MKHIPLGKTGLSVSEICLGTMTWGSQNTEAEGHAQMDYALDQGVNFWDCAEMYPVNPVRAETVGRSEEIIGSWIAARGGRSGVVLASKVAGEGKPEVRGGEALGGAVLRTAVEGALRRMHTDHIDLYQLHWPNRAVYHFRDIWTFDPRGPSMAEVEDHMLDVLRAARELIAEGKIGHIALSNETVWGTAKWLSLAAREGLPRMATVQNEYSLLCRQFDSDWSEMAVMENLPLLAFSPLATGLLTGKYAGDVTPEGTRRALNPTLGGRITPQVFPAVAAYLGVAARHGLDPAQMAIAFCLGRPFPCVPIIGAVNLEQLAKAINSAEVSLSPEVLAEIDAVHRAHPMPY